MPKRTLLAILTGSALLAHCAPYREPATAPTRFLGAVTSAPLSQTVLNAVERLKEQTGIDGDPITFDSKDPRYSDYLDRVRRMIKEKWVYPCVKDVASGHCEYKSAKLVIVFGILKDGRMPTVEVAEQSNHEIYDDVAVRAIKLASPFPPVPEEMLNGHVGVPVVATFRYIVEAAPKPPK